MNDPETQIFADQWPLEDASQAYGSDYHNELIKDGQHNICSDFHDNAITSVFSAPPMLGEQIWDGHTWVDQDLYDNLHFETAYLMEGPEV